MPTIDKPIWNTGLINNGKLEQVYELAVVRHGHWINANEGKWNTVEVLKCSACGEIDNRMERSDAYCPNCGAKMDEVEDD